MNSKFTGLGDADAVQKNLLLFFSKQRLLSIDMKTRVVHHVERVNERVKLVKVVKVAKVLKLKECESDF